MLPLGQSGGPSDVGAESVAGEGGWESVGGLEGHVNALKEMVLLPLLYPSLFQVLLFFISNLSFRNLSFM
jgi:hypothetical protein